MKPLNYAALVELLLGQNPQASRSIVRRPPGMRQEGNIDLNKRPRVSNPDGSYSTIRSMSVGMPEGEVLMPAVRDDGWYMSPDQAMRQYHETGKHLGIFDDPNAATAYARLLSMFQGAKSK